MFQPTHSLPVPEPALREVVLNTLIHRDYTSNSPVQIRVYADKLKIWNSAELPESWTIEDLLGQHSSRPFNPSVANDLGMEFPFSKVYLSLLGEYDAGKKLDEGSPKGSPKTDERIVNLMLNHPQISTEAIADNLKISKRCAQADQKATRTRCYLTTKVSLILSSQLRCPELIASPLLPLDLVDGIVQRLQEAGTVARIKRRRSSRNLTPLPQLGEEVSSGKGRTDVVF
jgi:hypothetical protein